MISRDLLHTYFCQGKLCCCQHINLKKDERVFTRQCYMLKFHFKPLKNHKANKQKGGKKPQTFTTSFQNEFYLYAFLKTLFALGNQQYLTKFCKDKRANHTNISVYAGSFPMHIKAPKHSFTRHWSTSNRFAIAAADLMENGGNAHLLSITFSKRHPVLPQLHYKSHKAGVTLVLLQCLK